MATSWRNEKEYFTIVAVDKSDADSIVISFETNAEDDGCLFDHLYLKKFEEDGFDDYYNDDLDLDTSEGVLTGTICFFYNKVGDPEKTRIFEVGGQGFSAFELRGDVANVVHGGSTWAQLPSACANYVYLNTQENPPPGLFTAPIRAGGKVSNAFFDISTRTSGISATLRFLV